MPQTVAAASSCLPWILQICRDVCIATLLLCVVNCGAVTRAVGQAKEICDEAEADAMLFLERLKHSESQRVQLLAQLKLPDSAAEKTAVSEWMSLCKMHQASVLV